MNIKEIIVSVLCLVILATSFLAWSADHDRKVEESATKYEACVRSQYGTSPATWYADHGEYPECK